MIVRFITTLLVSILSVLLPISTVTAAEFTAAVSKTRVSKNEVFELVITTDQAVKQNSIDFSRLKDHFYLGQPSLYQSEHIINGKRRKQTQWRLSLAANQLGQLTIPSFTIDGVSTQPITIFVEANPSEPKAEDLVKLHASLDRDILYPQQNAQLTSKIIITADTRRLDNVRLVPPSVNGATLEPAGNAEQYSAIIDGLQATIVEQNFIIHSDEPGQYVITPPSFSAVFQYGDPRQGGNRILPIELDVAPLTLTIKPIPKEAVKPWLPATGLTLAQQWLGDNSQSDIATNQNSVPELAQGAAITREITLTTTGIDAKLIPEPQVNYPSSVRVYREKPQITILADGQSQITYKHTLIPTELGQLTLPAITVNWWNSREDRNIATSIPSKTVNIIAAKDSLLPTLRQEPASTEAPTTTTEPPIKWIVSTIIFATLWLITLVAWLRARRRTNTVTPQHTAAKTEPSLEQILNSGDTVLIIQAVERWLNSQTLDTQSERNVRNELQAMQRAKFAKTPNQWSADKLKQAIAHAKPSDKNSESNTLAPL
ncbi:BatD family protein [Vibrio agarilyticus]|nr:BatD family protein [Vibrio agarilyticus]